MVPLICSLIIIINILIFTLFRVLLSLSSLLGRSFRFGSRNDIDGDWAHVIVHEGHAALLVILPGAAVPNEDGAAAAEAITIVLTGHPIAAVDRPEDIAG